MTRVELLIQSWDLPADPQAMDAYRKKAREEWIPTVLRQPGLKDFRGYRNALRMSPHAMIHTEWEDLVSLTTWVRSDDYARIFEELRAFGCTNLTTQMWTTSSLFEDD